MVYTKEFKEVISFNYPCYICGQVLSKAKVCIDHIKRLHGYELPVRAVGHKRPAEPDYEFENNPAGRWDSQHYACPSCWYHCEQGEYGREGGLRNIAEHVQESHEPVNTDETKNENGQVTGLSLVPQHAPHHHHPQEAPQRGGGGGYKGKGRRRSSVPGSSGSRAGGSRRGSSVAPYDSEEGTSDMEMVGDEEEEVLNNGATVTRQDMKVVFKKLNEITALFKDLLK